MGKRGPKRTPSNILELRGSTWAKWKNPDEPMAIEDVGECPEWAMADSRPLYPHLSEVLGGMGLHSKSFNIAEALLLDSLVQYLDAREQVEREGGTVVTDKGNQIQHPAVGQRNDAFKRCLSMLREFGLTPASKASVSTSKNDTQEDSATAFLRKLKAN